MHGVAYRTALKARTMAARRRFHERRAGRMRPEAVEARLPDDLRELLDRELDRLPDKYRTPLILCELEGRSRREAARQLGLPEGTLSSRLAAGRAMLARRVVRGGVALSAVAALTSAASARVPPTLTISAVRAALRVEAGKAAGVSASVAALTEGVLQTMKPTPWHLAAVVLMVVGGAGLLALAGEKPARADKPPAGEKGAKDKGEVGPTVRGTARALDAAKKTITVALPAGDGTKKQTEKTYAVSADAKVILAENLTKDKPAPEGKVTDVTPGTGVELQLSLDGKTVEQITARGPALHGRLRSVDAAKNTITVATKNEKGPIEHTLTVVEGVKAVLSDGLTKEDKPQVQKVTGLEEGTHVLVHQSVDRKRAIGINVQNDTLRGSLKGIDNGTNVMTIEVKEDGGLVDKMLSLGKGAKVEGNPTAGDTVIVVLSVFDKQTAVRVFVP